MDEPRGNTGVSDNAKAGKTGGESDYSRLLRQTAQNELFQWLHVVETGRATGEITDQQLAKAIARFGQKVNQSDEPFLQVVYAKFLYNAHHSLSYSDKKGGAPERSLVEKEDPLIPLYDIERTIHWGNHGRKQPEEILGYLEKLEKQTEEEKIPAHLLTMVVRLASSICAYPGNRSRVEADPSGKPTYVDVSKKAAGLVNTWWKNGTSEVRLEGRTVTPGSWLPP